MQALSTLLVLVPSTSVVLAFAALTPASSPARSIGPAQADGARRVALEAKDGTVSMVALSELDLTDPRERGAWVVRPVGVTRSAPATGEEDEEDAPRAKRISAIVELANGDVLRGSVAGGRGEALELRLIGGITLSVDIADIRRVDFPEHVPAGRASVLDAPSEGDRLYRVTGTELDPTGGAVDAFTDEGVRFESDSLGLKVYPWREIGALFVEVLDASPRGGEDGVPVVVDLVDDSRLRGRLVRLGPDACRVAVAESEVAFPWEAVLELTVDDGSLRYLSTLAPALEEGRGAVFGDEFGMTWDHRVDRSVAGGPLRTAGVTYRRGLGMHAPTRVAWALDAAAGFDVFVASVGVDDSSLLNPEGARGSVVFRVVVDGTVAWESGVVRGGDAPVLVPAIDVAGKRELALECDAVDDFRGDRANWLRPRLVRK